MKNFKQSEIKTAKSNGTVEKDTMDKSQDLGPHQIPMMTLFQNPWTIGQSTCTATATSLCLFWQKQNFQNSKKLI